MQKKTIIILNYLNKPKCMLSTNNVDITIRTFKYTPDYTAYMLYNR